MEHTGPHVVTVAAKLPPTLAAQLEEFAESRGLSRSAVIRELVEGAVEERITFPSKEERAERGARIVTARIRDHARRLREHTEATQRDGTGFGLAELLRISVEARFGPPPGR